MNLRLGEFAVYNLILACGCKSNFEDDYTSDEEDKRIAHYVRDFLRKADYPDLNNF